MTKADSNRQCYRWLIGSIALLMVAAINAGQRCAIAQSVTDGGGGKILANGVPPQVRDVTVEQNLGGRVRKDLPLTDSNGRRIKTGYIFNGKRPTIVTLNYSSCPMLCSVQLNQLTQSLNQLDLKIGEDFQILTVSIDPKETTETIRKTKQSYVEQLLGSQPGAEEGWIFCTAQQPIITNLADSLGFRYTYDRASGEYYHPAMLAFLSPDGVITRYSLAIEFEPTDLRKALIEAGEGTVGTAVDQFVLWCFTYDPDSNSYVPVAWRIMRLGAAGTVGLMLAFLAPFWFGRKRLPIAPEGPSTDSPADQHEPDPPHGSDPPHEPDPPGAT